MDPQRNTHIKIIVCYTSLMESCTFCKIISNQLKGYIIDDSDEIISFLSLENHPLIVPKTHIPNIYELDKDVGSALMLEISRVATATKKGLNSDGIYITQANDSSGGQDVFHLHFHIYPRWKEKKVES